MFGMERWTISDAHRRFNVPQSKVSANVLSLDPCVHSDRLSGLLCETDQRPCSRPAKRWFAWVPGAVWLCRLCSRLRDFRPCLARLWRRLRCFARIAIPEMLKIGYNKQFAAGVVAAGGTLASLIPPSAILVIYAIIVEQDVGKLLLGRFHVPGACFRPSFMQALIIGIAMIWKTVGPPVSKGSHGSERFEGIASPPCQSWPWS